MRDRHLLLFELSQRSTLHEAPSLRSPPWLLTETLGSQSALPDMQPCLDWCHLWTLAVSSRRLRHLMYLCSLATWHRAVLCAPLRLAGHPPHCFLLNFGRCMIKPLLFSSVLVCLTVVLNGPPNRSFKAETSTFQKWRPVHFPVVAESHG